MAVSRVAVPAEEARHPTEPRHVVGVAGKKERRMPRVPIARATISSDGLSRKQSLWRCSSCRSSVPPRNLAGEDVEEEEEETSFLPRERRSSPDANPCHLNQASKLVRVGETCAAAASCPIPCFSTASLTSGREWQRRVRRCTSGELVRGLGAAEAGLHLGAASAVLGVLLELELPYRGHMTSWGAVLERGNVSVGGSGEPLQNTIATLISTGSN